MKRRLLMGLAAVIAVFSAENVVDILINRYANFTAEIAVWLVLALVAAFIVYEVGEDRGDW